MLDVFLVEEGFIDITKMFLNYFYFPRHIMWKCKFPPNPYFARYSGNGGSFNCGYLEKR